MLQENEVTDTEKDKESIITPTSDNEKSSQHNEANGHDEAFLMQCKFFESQLKTLTPTERNVFTLYLEGKTSKEIMTALNIKENTLKYHNKNIYGKLGVSSRKQMLELASVLKIKSI